MDAFWWILGVIIGVVLMCIVQLGRDDHDPGC